MRRKVRERDSRILDAREGVEEALAGSAARRTRHIQRGLLLAGG